MKIVVMIWVSSSPESLKSTVCHRPRARTLAVIFQSALGGTLPGHFEVKSKLLGHKMAIFRPTSMVEVPINQQLV